MPGAQIILELVHAARVGVGSRRDAQHAFEGTLQMERALMKFRSETRQSKRFIEVLLNIAAHGFYRSRRAAACCFGPAAQAGAITGLLGVIGLLKEGHVFPARATGRAGWPAVHASRRHGKNKITVLTGVTRQNRLPVMVLIVVVAALVADGRFPRFRQVEYRIGRHNDEILGRPSPADHPDLAVKATFLRYPDAFETKDLGHFSSVSSIFLGMSKIEKSLQADPSREIVATYVDHELRLEDSHVATEWRNAIPITFVSDWQGKNADPERETQVRILWSRQHLYLKFDCHYYELFTFKDSEPNGRRDHLWERDVAEAFLQPDPSRQSFYREFEVSPNGMWVDLDIFAGGRADLNSGLQRSIHLDEKSRTWTAELAIPMKSLTTNFDPTAIWRANFYRVEGRKEPRAYLAWQPTNTPQPNFHVPAAFGRLRFAGAPAKSLHPRT